MCETIITALFCHIAMFIDIHFLTSALPDCLIPFLTIHGVFNLPTFMPSCLNYYHLKSPR